MSRRLGVVGLLLVLVLTVGAGGRRTDVQFGWVVAPVSDTEKWVRIENVDPSRSLKIMEFTGDDFTVTAIKSARASGASTPSCSVSTGLVRCDGDLPPQSSLFLNVVVAGSGGNFEIGASDDPSNLVLAPGVQGPPLLPIVARLVTAGATTKRITFTSRGNAFDELEILPYGFTVDKVASITAKGSCDPEGPGVDCSITLPPQSGGVVTFGTSGAGTDAEVILSGDDGVGAATVTQTAGMYDLVASARPTTIRYRRGQSLRRIPITFLVLNASAADVPSGRVSATVEVAGSSQALLGAALSCPVHNPVAASLAPGVFKKVCSLSITPSPTIVRKAGKLSVLFRVACAANLETSCANNRARATIVVE
jgi:hypothetical protein